jgi:hypothetical protein
MNENSPNDLTNNIANADFESALRKSFWHTILHWFKKNNNSLLNFDEFRKEIPWEGQHDRGMQEIMLDDIVGSVGRYQDFDRSFLPRHFRSRDRWINIDKLHLKDISIPPIEVYKIGTVYFVKDGNHRVSVARERGQAYIEANVIEIESAIPIDASTNIDDLISKKEQLDFNKRTGIMALRPDASIKLTLPGGYDTLIEHIRVHGWFQGERHKRPIPWTEAVTHWYDKVYLPLIAIIRANQMLNEFPQRSEADLYLWIMDHLWYLRQDGVENITMEDAATHFVRKYSKKPLKRFRSFITGLFKRHPHK